ncbi:hypothetical protein [Marinobacterium marinum]|uniref:Uncharacterized protein n=1 Tax=Marinobacterium marinum TaxID=2756129 RepID=A0A7W2ADQ7_9GAMM|nr:hypothetical protein [Marinobacterium marinum]MBA4503458.1 hypothetical protein [Marinobacterium marinum]
MSMKALLSLLCCTLLLAMSAGASTGSHLGYGKRFPARWLEHENQIRLDTVCYNYPESSYMYHFCRQEAGKTLATRCQRYRNAQQRQPDNSHYLKLTEKYCTAARLYQPFPSREHARYDNDQ